MQFENIQQLAQYGIGVLSLGVLVYVISIFTKAIQSNNIGDKIDALTAAIENNTKMICELQELIRQQGMFIQRAVEKLDALWDISVKKA